MASTIDYSRLNDIHCQARPRPTKVQRGEHLDLFPARLTHHSVPPLMSLVVNGLLPPMYILGWYYTINDFAERFGRGDALNVFEARILGPFHEKYGDEMPDPFLDSRLTDNHSIVFIASNSFPSALDLPDKERVIEGVKAILQEDRDPEWIRIPDFAASISEHLNFGVDTSNYTTSDLIITKDAVSSASKARDDARGANARAARSGQRARRQTLLRR